MPKFQFIWLCRKYSIKLHFLPDLPICVTFYPDGPMTWIFYVCISTFYVSPKKISRKFYVVCLEKNYMLSKYAFKVEIFLKKNEILDWWISEELVAYIITQK